MHANVDEGGRGDATLPMSVSEASGRNRGGLRRLQCVLHHHRDDHGSHTPGDGGDGRRLQHTLVEIDVASQNALAIGRLSDLIDPEIDDHRPVLDHVPGDVVWDADGGDDNVCAAGVGGEVLGARVAHGDGGVARGVLHEHCGDGFPGNVGPANDHDLRPGDRLPGAQKKLIV
jgi:hypothetical protein